MTHEHSGASALFSALCMDHRFADDANFDAHNSSSRSSSCRERGSARSSSSTTRLGCTSECSPGREDHSYQMLQIIRARADAIETRLTGGVPDLDDVVERVKDHCNRARAGSIRYKWVPPNYYDTSLAERARELGCAPEQLCKTMIMENKAFTEDASRNAKDGEPKMHRHYLVVVQYAARLSAQKISALMLRLHPGAERLPRARCNLQVAAEEVGLDLSGFPHNGVSVFGGLTPMPVIMSEAVLGLRPAYIWMGGGHPLLKLGVSARDLVERLDATVADISVPRDGTGGPD